MTLLTALHCRSEAHKHGARALGYLRGTLPLMGVPGVWPGSAQLEARDAARWARAALYLEERQARKLRLRAA